MVVIVSYIMISGIWVLLMEMLVKMRFDKKWLMGVIIVLICLFMFGFWVEV